MLCKEIFTLKYASVTCIINHLMSTQFNIFFSDIDPCFSENARIKKQMDQQVRDCWAETYTHGYHIRRSRTGTGSNNIRVGEGSKGHFGDRKWKVRGIMGII